MFKFKDFTEDDIVCTSEPLYDIFDGGYICPFKLLVDEEEAHKVQEAINLVHNFLACAEDVGVVEVG